MYRGRVFSLWLLRSERIVQDANVRFGVLLRGILMKGRKSLPWYGQLGFSLEGYTWVGNVAIEDNSF
jgi:hypothetical protein